MCTLKKWPDKSQIADQKSQLNNRRATAQSKTFSTNCNTAGRSSSEVRDRGIKVDLIDFSWDPRTRLRLSVERDHRQILRSQITSSDALTGDDTVSYDFIGEMLVDGIPFPKRIVFSLRGVPFTDATTVKVDVNPIFDDGTFARPVGYTEQPAASQAYLIGDGIYEMVLGDGPDNYVHFFDLGNGVAIFDAPESADTSRAVVAQVTRVLGDKPISYVVLSHFHDDHAAGLGYYAELGVKIVTTRDNASVLTRYAHAASQLDGEPAATARPLHFVFVDEASLRLPGAGGRSLTVYRLNNLPHVKSMLIAYYPSAQTMANSDLFGEFAPFDTNSLLFAKWLSDVDAPKVDWIVGGHHRKLSQSDFQGRAASFALLGQQ